MCLKFKTKFFLFLILSTAPARLCAWDWLGGGDHTNSNWTVNASSAISGFHYNIKTFTLAKGATLFVKDFDGVNYGSVTVRAKNVYVYGMVNANGAGYAGGTGGVAQSTVTAGGNCGMNGSPASGGGSAGAVGLSSATVSGSGAGGGGGGGYGGSGAAGGAGGTNPAPGFLAGGTGGSGGIVCGTESGNDIGLGSGGGGAGGGGAGGPEANTGGGGGSGGDWGGSVRLEANYIVISGTISACGSAGGTGGTGGGVVTHGGGGGSGAGGGSGGGIYIYGANSVTISTSAYISVKGGNGGAGGIAYGSGGGAGNIGGSGGGGRIKIFYSGLVEYGALNCSGASYLGSNGSAGTIYRESLVNSVVDSVFPADDAYGISVDSHIIINFNQDMASGTVVSALTVRAVIDNLNNAVSTDPVTGTGFYVPGEFKFTFVPDSDFHNNYVYEVVLSTAAEGKLHNHIAQQLSWRFRTKINTAVFNRIVTADSSMQLTISSGTLPAGGYVTARSASGTHLTGADNKIVSEAKLQRISNAIELNAYDSASGEITGPFNKDITLVFYYDDADDDGFVDSSNPPVSENNLAVYWLNETDDLWVKVDASSVNGSSNTVSAGIGHFTAFSLIGSLSDVLTGAYAYPVPYCPSDNNPATGTCQGGITFTNLSSECAISIYTVYGRLIKSIDVTPFDMNTKNWNARGDDGREVSSGVYVYRIESGTQSQTGKLVIVR